MNKKNKIFSWIIVLLILVMVYLPMRIPFPSVNLTIVGICGALSLILLGLMWPDVKSKGEKRQHIILIAFLFLVTILMLILYSK